MKSTVRTDTHDIEVIVSTTGNIFITTTDRTYGATATCGDLRPGQAIDLASLLRSAADIATRRMETRARGDA
jgi:hypothetical protein